MLLILFSWLLADFLSGVVHWWEDRAMKGASKFEFLNRVREDNERHHKAPGFMLRYSYWENVNTTMPAAFAISAILMIMGVPTFICLAVFFTGFGNLVHRWAHDPPARLNTLIKVMQFTGLFISKHHHDVHHYTEQGTLISREGATERYCVMTNWLNPTLDKVGLWRALDRLV